jgi:16S rRNA processing protein RimM
MGRTAGSTSSTDDSTPARRVRVGRVVGAHGLAGELRVDLLGADPEAFAGADTVWLARDESDPAATPHALRAVGAGRAGECRVALEGIADRAAAESLRGAWLLARTADLARPEPGAYYVYELVGCRVFDGTGRALGVVSGIWETGASDVLIVEDESGREHFVPAVRALLLEVDVAARRIAVDALPGLFETDA